MRLLHGEPVTKMALSHVLLGAWEINECGLVTITRELVDFVPTKPEECASRSGEMKSLWLGLVDLVQTTLIPMAAETVVYADMRPGWTETSNILRRFELSNDGKNCTTLLRLIDYESICQVSKVPEDDSRRTFQIDYDESIENSDYTALRFLWWQCMFMAYTWAMQLNVAQGVYDARIFVNKFHVDDLDSSFWYGIDPTDKAELVDIEKQATITVTMITRTMQILSGLRGLSI